MRLIDADALKIEIACLYGSNPKYINWLNHAPTVDAVPVRHGKWLSREEGKVYPFWERYTCSVCGKHADDTDYCPNCGARMDKDETD